MFVTVGTSVMGLSFQSLFVIFVVVCWCCVLVLATLLLTPLKVVVMIVFFMTLADLLQYICWNILCFMIIGIYKMHIKEINIKIGVCNCYFDNLIKAKKVETNIILIDEISYKILIIWFTSTRFVHMKSIKMLHLHEIIWLMIVC